MSDDAGPAPKMARLEDEAASWMQQAIRFDDPDPNTHDVVIQVKDQKFYCAKMTLARHSSFFYDKFFKDPKHIGKKELTLDEPDNAEEFEAFLKILHGVNNLDDKCIRGVLKLSVAWGCGVSNRQCLDFLEKTRTMPMKEKFDITVEFKLDDLKRKIIAECSTSGMLHEIMPTDLMDLDHETMGLILERNLALQGFPGRYVPEPRRRSPSPELHWVPNELREYRRLHRRPSTSSSSSDSTVSTINSPHSSDEDSNF